MTLLTTTLFSLVMGFAATSSAEQMDILAKVQSVHCAGKNSAALMNELTLTAVPGTVAPDGQTWSPALLTGLYTHEYISIFHIGKSKTTVTFNKGVFDTDTRNYTFSSTVNAGTSNERNLTLLVLAPEAGAGYSRALLTQSVAGVQNFSVSFPCNLQLGQ